MFVCILLISGGMRGKKCFLNERAQIIAEEIAR